MSPLLGYDTILPPPFTGILLRLPTLWAAAVFRHGWTQNRRGLRVFVRCGYSGKWNMSETTGRLRPRHRQPGVPPEGATHRSPQPGRGRSVGCAAAANSPEKSPFFRPFLRIWVKSTLFQMWTAAGTFHFPKWAGFKLVPVIAHTLPGRRKLRRFYFCWHNTSGKIFSMNWETAQSSPSTHNRFILTWFLKCVD